MDIDNYDGADGSITFTVKLTLQDIEASPNAMAVLCAATTCGEILLALSLLALEMQNRGGEFQAALREATAVKKNYAYRPDITPVELPVDPGGERRGPAERRVSHCSPSPGMEQRSGAVRRKTDLDPDAKPELVVERRTATVERRSAKGGRRSIRITIAHEDRRSSFTLSRRHIARRRTDPWQLEHN